ncbi:CAP domain-containing protein [Polycladidibacter hongkongensis]|uniref:CAP domain-containing protein n=1 Tax=Polycladidibacter hongkongensis TaxID=1647556 RepID=UPI00082D494D|nr:CAP domain-containing protein [Pseudovibrio hongkongensis]
MRKLYISACALLGLLVLVGCNSTSTEHVDMSEVAISQSAALAKLNSYRRSHGLAPLKADLHLKSVSQNMANHIAQQDSLATSWHSAYSLKQRTQTNNYRSFAGAENLGAGYTSLDAAITGWKTSKDHNKNLLNPNVTHMGIARTSRADGTYRNFWVMTLAAPLSGS